MRRWAATREPVLSLDASVFGLLIGGVNGVLLGVLLWAASGVPRRARSRLVIAMGAAVGVTHAPARIRRGSVSP